jgi:predicted RNase H-like nuclease
MAVPDGETEFFTRGARCVQLRVPTAWVAGVDGCRGGWAVAIVPAGPVVARRPLIRVCEDVREALLLRSSPAVIAGDSPIGLLDGPRTGGRLCDRLAFNTHRSDEQRVQSALPPRDRRSLRMEIWY